MHVVVRQLYRLTIGKFLHVDLARPKERGVAANKRQHPAIR